MNWEPLASGDPLAGDADGIQSLCNVLSRYAQECADLANKVTNLNSIDWVGDAADAFRSKQVNFTPKLKAVSERLGSTSQVLTGFSSSIRSIQAQARSLLSTAQQLNSEIYAVSPLASEQHQYNLKQDLEIALGKPYVPWSGPNYMAQRQHLASNLKHVEAKFQNLVSEYQQAASFATRQMSQVSHDSLANNLFSVLGHFVNQSWDIALQSDEQLLKDVWHAAEYLAPGVSRVLHDFSGILSILVLIPIPGLQEIVGALLLVVSVALLVSDIVLTVDGSSGGGWMTLASDVVGIGGGAAVAQASHELNVAADAAKVTEDSSGTSSLLDTVKSYIVAPKVPDGATLLTSFPARLQVESTTLNVLGEAQNVTGYIVDNPSVVHNAINSLKSSMTDSLLPTLALSAH